MSKIILTPDTLLKEIKAIDLSCGDPQQSYSPFFSSIGLIADEKTNGVGDLLFHYNRATRPVFHKAIGFYKPLNCKLSDFTRLVCGNDELSVSFFEKNSFVAVCKTDRPIPVFFEPDPLTESFWFDLSDPLYPMILGYSENQDARDPDRYVPFAIMLRPFSCRYTVNDNVLSFLPERSDTVCFAATIELLEYDTDRMKTRLQQAPQSAETAVETTERWAYECVKDFKLTVPDAQTAEKICFSVLGLLFNLTRAEGALKNHISAFPNRGVYPTHYLWDTCFQNLAYENMSLSLAEDLILQNIDMQRNDGKYGQFLCSTWARPHDSQPALIGWAAYRLARKTQNRSFVDAVIPSLIRNTKWWLTQRRTDCGLIYTLGGLETGQDNSPRFDNGPTIAADMNAFLLNQMCCIARLAEMAEDKRTASEWDRRAKDYAARIRDVLYDSDTGIFFDLELKSRKKVRVLSPSGLLPLWAGDVLSQEESKQCIRKHLLKPDSMFGAFPFPSVSYFDPAFDSSDWWRGPVWLPIACLMLECLEKYGFTEEKTIAAERLYKMTAADGEMHELFDSLTGKGMGSAQQGWTCAVFIRLLELLGTAGNSDVDEV